MARSMVNQSFFTCWTLFTSNQRMYPMCQLSKLTSYFCWNVFQGQGRGMNSCKEGFTTRQGMVVLWSKRHWGFSNDERTKVRQTWPMNNTHQNILLGPKKVLHVTWDHHLFAAGWQLLFPPPTHNNLILKCSQVPFGWTCDMWGGRASAFCSVLSWPQKLWGGCKWGYTCEYSMHMLLPQGVFNAVKKRWGEG